MQKKKWRNKYILLCLFLCIIFWKKVNAQLPDVKTRFYLLYSKKIEDIITYDTVIMEYGSRFIQEGSFLLKSKKDRFMTAYLLRPRQLPSHPHYSYAKINIHRNYLYLAGLGVWDQLFSGKICHFDTLQPTNFKSAIYVVEKGGKEDHLITFKTYPICSLKRSFQNKRTTYLFMNKPIDSVACVKPYWFLTKFVDGIGFVGFEEFDLQTNRRTATIELVSINGRPLNRIPRKYLRYFPKIKEKK